MVKLFSVKCSSKRICCVSNNHKAANPFLTIQTKTYVSVFLDCPKIPFWSLLSLTCCCLFKTYTSYIISKCQSVNIINIPWFLVPHFHLLESVKEWFFRNTNGRQIRVVRINTFTNIVMFIFRELRIYLFTCEKIAFMSSTETIIPFHITFLRLHHENNVFCGINFCDGGILWKKCWIYFRDPNVLANFFQSSLKMKIRYIWE